MTNELVDDVLAALTKELGYSGLLSRLIRAGGEQHWYRKGDDNDPPLLLIVGPTVAAANQALNKAGI